ncbi:MAG: peptidoglycan editing factor PgeF [Moorellales bacterium]
MAKKVVGVGAAGVRLESGPEAEFFQIEDWEPYAVTAGFSTRRKGVSGGPYAALNLGFNTEDEPQAVLQNRLRLARQLNLPLERWVAAHQVHGTRVAVVGAAEAGRGAATPETALAEADALITSTAGLVLTAYFADCVPLLFFCPQPRAVGVAHAGWRGTAAGVAQAVVAAFRAHLGVEAPDLRVVVGPHVGSCCYRVGEEVVAALAERLGRDTSGWATQKEGQWWVDLGEANIRVLERSGLGRDQIRRFSPCTSCRVEWFYSFRRDRRRTGRFTALICLRS